jgi:predicted permease
MIAFLRRWFGKAPADAALDDELRACVEMLAAQKTQAGAAPDEARRQALAEIGSFAVVKRRVHRVRRAAALEATWRDVRLAVRVLNRHPLGTAAIVLTLGIGIAAPAAAFSLLNRFVFAPPPTSPDPDAYFRISRPRAQAAADAALYRAYLDQVRSARAIAAWSAWMVHAPLGTDDPSPVSASLVSCNVLSLFGATVPVAGRLLVESDCAGDQPVAVMGEHVWRTRFGSDPSVVGSALRYGSALVPIVGVVAGPSLRRNWDDADEIVDLWIPYSAHAQLKEASFARSAAHGWLEIGGLLQPGVSREAAAEEFRAIQAALTPAGRRPPHLDLTDGSRWAGAPADMLGLLATTLALPLLILVMACVNASAMLLSRSAKRRPEMAVRLALGTSRGALVRMLLVETLLMAALAAGVGLVVVYALPPALVRFFDAATWFGTGDALEPDWRAIAGLALCGLAAAALSGLAPAFASRHSQAAGSLNSRTGAAGDRGVSWRRRVLVGVQVAATLVPLVAAVSFATALGSLATPGFQTDNVLVALLPRETPAAVSVGSIADTIAVVPGVHAVAFGATVPLAREPAITLQRSDATGRTMVPASSVSANYFDVFGIPMLAGRTFDRQDAGAAGAEPAIVSRQFARRFFPGGDALGAVVDVAESNKPIRLTIVGIAGDRLAGYATSSAALSDGSMIYRRLSSAAASGVLFVKSEGPPEAIADLVRAGLRDAMGTAATVRTLDSTISDSLAGVGKIQTILLVLGTVALVLALVGIVGTVTFDAGQRRREFAIRCALGAAPAAVRRRIVGGGLRPIAAGLVAGTLLSWGALTFADAARLSPIPSIASNPLPYAAAAALLLVAALGALYTIAVPASRRDPLLSLRDE